MNNHTDMPKITFAPDTDYSSLWALLFNAGLGIASYQSDRRATRLVEQGLAGSLFTFFLSDGRELTGMMTHPHDQQDCNMSVRIYDADANPTDEVVTFDADLLTEVMYL